MGWKVRKCQYFFTLYTENALDQSAVFLEGGVKNYQNLLTDSKKKPPTGGGRGQKWYKFDDILNEWSLAQDISIMTLLKPLLFYFLEDTR